MNAAHNQLLDEQQLDNLLRGVFITRTTGDTDAAAFTTDSAAIIFGGEQLAAVTPQADRAARKRLGIKRAMPRFLLNSIFIIVIGCIALFLVHNLPLNKQDLAEASDLQLTPANNEVAGISASPVVPPAAGETAVTEEQQNIQGNTTAVLSDTATANDSTPVSKTSIPQQQKAGYNPSRRPEQYSYPDDDIPVLSPKEIEENNKQKLAMLRAIVRRDGIIKVDPGTALRNGESVPTPQFEMKFTEVTTQEYKVFLNDLIISGRYDDYLQARVDKKGWAAKGIAGMDEKYMSAGYKAFPVVNISRTGALLFCDWLTRSFEDASQQKTIKANEYGLRLRFELPLDVEWIRAARCKNKTAVYTWGGSSTQNLKGCFLANFNYTKSKDKVVPTNSECMSKSPKAKDALSTAGHSIDSLITCPVTSYNPNEFGFYCMSGNVAEMVWQWDIKNAHKPAAAVSKPLAMGGSWNSSCDNVTIESPENYAGITSPDAEIGFRYVIRTVSKPLTEKVTYTTSGGENRIIDVPVLGEQMLKQIARTKKEMTENLLSHKGYSLAPTGSYNRNGKTVSLQSFYIQQYEVSNSEYRAFLYDLVAQKRYADFERANVCGSCWVDEWKGASYNDPMDEHYFNHPAYDNYPVVNVPREGAALYCTWLTKTAHEEQLRKDKTAAPVNDVRLPADIEWEYAAHAGNDSTIYPWSGIYLRNAKGQFLANYCALKNDSAGRTRNDYISDGAFHTAPRNSYFPNAWNLYNMAGNVSEMVVVMQPGTSGQYVPAGIASKGGNWTSYAQNIRIQAEEEYKEVTRPTPYIGFRVVMTNTSQSR
jgi:formylglycine-generating enzyme required for sulfatase activity